MTYKSLLSSIRKIYMENINLFLFLGISDSFQGFLLGMCAGINFLAMLWGPDVLPGIKPKWVTFTANALSTVL